MQATGPDITYAVNILIQFVGDPRVSYLEAANCVRCYLKERPRQGILLTKDDGTNLTAYYESD